MSKNQNKLSRFWQELKRRRVIHVITVYASAAFVIIELVNNLTEPLNLPTSLSTIVIIALAVGFPLAIVLSWIYDLTSGTFERTKPMEDIPGEEKAKVPNAWKIATYVSFIVIIGLVVLNIVSRGDILKPGSIQSMVVLPFHNYTGDDQLEYFVSGMHSSLIGDMGKVGGLRILSETTSNIYKNADKSVQEIASELGVDAVVEPTVTALGDTICLQVKVFSTYPEEKLLFVTEYKEDKSKILSLYNRITKQIAGEVKVELTEEEETLLADARTVNKEAYDHYLMGRQYWDRLGKEDLEKALDHFNIAIALDPEWAAPYAGVAQVYVGMAQFGYVMPEQAMSKIYSNLDKAIELDPNFVDAHYTNGLVGVWTEWNWDKGEKEFLKALKINPNDVMSRIYYAHLLMILKRYDEASFHSQMAVELDPMNPLILALSAVVDLSTDNVQSALDKCNKALSIDPQHFFAMSIMDYASYANGDYQKSVEMLINIKPELGEEAHEAMYSAYENNGYKAAIDTMLIHLEEYGRYNYVGYPDMAEYYLRVGKREKAIECYEKGFELHDPNMPYVNQPIFGFNKVKDDPGFIALMIKMNLPLEPQE